LQTHYSLAISYLPNPGHLWFLANIFIYVLILIPVFYYFKQNEEAKIVVSLKKLFSTPLGLIAVIAVFMIESVIVNPAIYELYAMTWHGFFLGLIAFFFGFCFVMSGPAFWKMLLQWKWVFLVLAILLYGNRLMAEQMQVNTLLIVLESNFWIFSVFAFSHQYLNKESKVLTYLSESAYSVYIVHMLTLYLTSLLVFPLEINSWLKFLLVLTGTFGGSFFLYEFIIKRLKILRFLFGLKTASKRLKKTTRISKPHFTSFTVYK
ncbi:MAG: acyltransferase family protein, partial [Rhodothermaceae bacterium]|nr:acyltransferase family protein [Rhodothermaceae bacterium]